MFMQKWRQSGEILRLYSSAVQSEVIERSFQINRVPKRDYIDNKPEGTKLIFLPFSITLPEFASLSMKASASNAVSSFLSI